MTARGRFLSYGTLAALAFAGAALVIVSTPHGIGVSPDSTKYIGAARNMLAGRGYSFGYAPLTHFPPLYSTILAASGVGGLDPHSAARWLSALIFGGTIFLSGYAILRYSAGSRFWAVVAATLALVAAPLFHIHSFAWSEQLFILLSLAGMLWLAQFLDRRRRRHLALAGAAVGAACLTRYLGPTLIGAGMLGLLLLQRRPWRARLIDATLFAAISCLPLACWMTRNLAVAGTAANRQFAVHVITSRDLKEGTAVLSSWVVPRLSGRAARTLDRSTRAFVLLPLYVGLLGLAVARRPRIDDAGEPTPLPPPELRRLPALLGLFAAVFMSFLLISRSYFDAMTQMNERILAPLFLPMTLAGLCLTHDAMRRPWRRVAQFFLLAALGTSCLVANGGKTLDQARESRSRGLGFAGERYRHSPTARYARELPADVKIYSNSSEMLSFLTRRDAALYPTRVDLFTNRPNPNFERELDGMTHDIQAGTAVIVDFAGRDKAGAVTVDEIAARLPLAPLHLEPDGAIYAGAAGLKRH